MKLKGWSTLLIAAAAVAVIARPAHAATWGGEVFGAFNTYSMGDWNDAVAFVNASGGNADEISSGFGGGLGLRLWPSGNWMIAGTWEPMFASTEDNASGDKFELTGNSFQATGAYFFPTAGNGKFGLGAGLGFYGINGKREATPNPDIDLAGSTVGFHFLGLGEWEVSPGFSITGSAGYRVARIDDTEFDGQSTSPKFETDYSGLMLRAGLAFYMPSR